jgi:hypothetical protein
LKAGGQNERVQNTWLVPSFVVRWLDWVLVRTLSHPAAYDLGYTHPNFELRLLTVNDMISNTPTSHRLLESFLAKRAAGTSILYQSPAAKR